MWRLTLQFVLAASSVCLVVAQVPGELSNPATVAGIGIEGFFAESEPGMLSPAARITFFRTAVDQLCVVIAARRGPGAIPKNYFSFRRLVTTDNGTRAAKLKFKFGKGIASPAGRYSKWEQCMPGESRDLDAAQDMVEITIRRPGQEPTSFSVANPETGFLRGTDIREDPYGHMSSRTFVDEIDAI